MSFEIHCETLIEKQDNVLDQATDALADNKPKRAISILKANLTEKNFHLESYLFLANFHLSTKNYSKGFRVLHFIIKKLHSKKLLKSPNISNIAIDCKTVKKPSKNALEAYARIAQKYFELADSEVFSERFSKVLTKRSLKYYNILNYFNFDNAGTKYMLAVLHEKLENTQVSYTNLLDSRDFYLDGTESDSKDQLENISYMLGDNLIRSGFTDAGALYLKSLVSSPNTDKSLKEYASTYLDSLSYSFLTYSAKLGKHYNNNVNSLTDDDLSNFESLQSFYISENAWSESLSFNVFYNSSIHGHWSYFTYANFDNQTMSNKGLSIRDSRAYSTSFETKYDNFQKSLLKLNISWSYTLYKESAGINFSKYSNLYSISPGHTYMFDRGSFTTKLTYSATSSISDDNLGESSILFTYQPFWKSNWISTSYSFEYSNVKEETDADISKRYFINFTNYSAISSNHSLFFSIDATVNKNTSLGYKEANMSLTHTYLVPWIYGLNLSLNISYQYNDPDTSDLYKVLEYGATLGYNF